jgi:D-aminoacyl-tRNA deacylase
MRLVLQRVTEASVAVGGERIAATGQGLLILVGVSADDDPDAAGILATKTAQLRIFENADGRLDRSILDIDGEALVVSQFTLMANTAKGNRPSFSGAASYEKAAQLVEAYCTALAAEGVRVQTGAFGARMSVGLVNDGPVPIVLERSGDDSDS